MMSINLLELEVFAGVLSITHGMFDFHFLLCVWSDKYGERQYGLKVEIGEISDSYLH